MTCLWQVAAKAAQKNPFAILLCQLSLRSKLANNMNIMNSLGRGNSLNNYLGYKLQRRKAAALQHITAVSLPR
jgi:hypothetical protein